MSANVKDIDIVGIASGLLTQIFEYTTDQLRELETQYGLKRNSFSWRSSLPSPKLEALRGTCFSTIEESLIIAAHFSTQPHATVLFAKCGNDPAGETFTRLMKKYGIRYDTPPTPVRPTFLTNIYVAPEDKEPIIVSLLGGASDLLRIGDVDVDAVKRAKFLMADAYNISLQALHKTTIQASHLAHEHNTKIVYGLGRHEVIRDNRQQLEAYVDLCTPDIINGNQFEFKELLFQDADKQLTDEELSRATQKYIRSKGVETAIITFAERGSRVICHNEIVPIDAYALPEAAIKDKACAGTAYMGGFLAARCQGKGYETAGKWGAYAARQTLQQYGLHPDWKIPQEISILC